MPQRESSYDVYAELRAEVKTAIEKTVDDYRRDGKTVSLRIVTGVGKKSESLDEGFEKKLDEYLAEIDRLSDDYGWSATFDENGNVTLAFYDNRSAAE